MFLIYTVFFTFTVLLWEPTDISREKLLLIMLIFDYMVLLQNHL